MPPGYQGGSTEPTATPSPTPIHRGAEIQIVVPLPSAAQTAERAENQSLGISPAVGGYMAYVGALPFYSCKRVPEEPDLVLTFYPDARGSEVVATTSDRPYV